MKIRCHTAQEANSCWWALRSWNGVRSRSEPRAVTGKGQFGVCAHDLSEDPAASINTTPKLPDISSSRASYLFLRSPVSICLSCAIHPSFVRSRPILLLLHSLAAVHPTHPAHPIPSTRCVPLTHTHSRVSVAKLAFVLGGFRCCVHIDVRSCKRASKLNVVRGT